MSGNAAPLKTQGKDAYIENGTVWPLKSDSLKNLTVVNRDLFETISLCQFYPVWIQTFTPFQATAHPRVEHPVSYPILPHTTTDNTHACLVDTYTLFGVPGSV